MLEDDFNTALGADEDKFARHSNDPRRYRAYVKFEPTHQHHNGPMYGPYDGVDLKKDLLTAWKLRGPVCPIAKRQSDGLWYLCDSPKEPGYLGFAVTLD